MFGSPNSGRLSRDILDTCSGGVQDDCSRFVVDDGASRVGADEKVVDHPCVSELLIEWAGATSFRQL